MSVTLEQIRKAEFSGAFIIFCKQCGPIYVYSQLKNIPNVVTCPKCRVNAEVGFRRRSSLKTWHVRKIEAVHGRSRVLRVLLAIHEVRKTE